MIYQSSGDRRKLVFRIMGIGDSRQAGNVVKVMPDAFRLNV